MAKRILVVDDNEDLLALLTEALQDEGYDVVTCMRSREAYGAAKSANPDLVLLDLLMPAMSGWEVLNLFLLDRELSKTPVLLMTGAVPEARKRLARLDMHDISILAKPFGLDHLLDQVEQALGRPRECEMLHDRITSLVTPLPKPGER